MPIEPSGVTASAETLTRRQETAIDQGFLDAIQSVVFPNEPFTQSQAAAVSQIALNACVFFDEGTNMLDWASSNGLMEDEAFDQQEYEFLLITSMAVGAVCPEHAGLIDAWMDGVDQAMSSGVAP